MMDKNPTGKPAGQQDASQTSNAATQTAGRDPREAGKSGQTQSSGQGAAPKAQSTDSSPRQDNAQSSDSSQKQDSAPRTSAQAPESKR